MAAFSSLHLCVCCVTRLLRHALCNLTGMRAPWSFRLFWFVCMCALCMCVCVCVACICHVPLAGAHVLSCASLTCVCLVSQFPRMYPRPRPSPPPPPSSLNETQSLSFWFPPLLPHITLSLFSLYVSTVDLVILPFLPCGFNLQYYYACTVHLLLAPHHLKHELGRVLRPEHVQAHLPLVGKEDSHLKVRIVARDAFLCLGRGGGGGGELGGRKKG